VQPQGYKQALQISNTFYQQFATDIFKQLPQPPTNLNFCNKQCTLQTARVDLANEILTASGKYDIETIGLLVANPAERRFGVVLLQASFA